MSNVIVRVDVLCAGTLDAIACTPQKEQVLTDLLLEVGRVLAPGGVYLCVSHTDRTSLFLSTSQWVLIDHSLIQDRHAMAWRRAAREPAQLASI